MLLAADYPLLDVFLSILWFALFFLWIWILIAVIVDLFASRDLSGFAKAIWFIALLFLPFLGVFIYLLARGHKMQRHAEVAAQAQESAQQAYIRDVAASRPPTKAEEIEQLAQLRDGGLISAEEYESQKTLILSRS